MCVGGSLQITTTFTIMYSDGQTCQNRLGRNRHKFIGIYSLSLPVFLSDLFGFCDIYFNINILKNFVKFVINSILSEFEPDLFQCLVFGDDFNGILQCIGFKVCHSVSHLNRLFYDIYLLMGLNRLVFLCGALELCRNIVLCFQLASIY